MTQKLRQGGAKLTPANGRQGKRLRGDEKHRVNGTQFTPEKGTRRYKPRARMCANKDCRKTFTPAAKHGRFCSNACRKVEARRRKAKGLTVQKVERDVVLTTCLWCGNTFLPEEGRGAKYCTDSHRTLASRKRREATISAISDTTGMTLDAAEQLVASAGMKHCARWLKQQGMAYNDSLRRWLVPMYPTCLSAMKN